MEDLRAYDPRETDAVAAWFFRLNGCLTIHNFIVHGTRRKSQLTDADVVALRFPHRRERDWEDHALFAQQRHPRVFLVEVKATGPCQFNSSWRDPDSDVLSLMLERIGCYTDADRSRAIRGLRQSGGYVGRSVDAVLAAVANRRSTALTAELPEAKQLLWKDIFAFMLPRFREYEKRQHHQWDDVGQRLHMMARMAGRDPELFERLVRDQYFPPPRQH